jgi:hypothetical protein
MARHLFIVSRHHPRLYEYLVERFRDDVKVGVILDRRVSEPAGEPPEGERRRPRPADDDLDVRSHIIVTIDD